MICYRSFAFQANDGQWMQVDADLDMYDGEICGTRNPTDQLLLVEMHFEPVYGKFDYVLLRPVFTLLLIIF